MIVDARTRYEGRGWLNYDHRFCQSAAADPTRKWSSLDSDLWHMCFTGLRRRSIQCQFCQMSTHTSPECIWSPNQQSSKQVSTEVVFQSTTPVCKNWNFSPNPAGLSPPPISLDDSDFDWQSPEDVTLIDFELQCMECD